MGSLSAGGTISTGNLETTPPLKARCPCKFRDSPVESPPFQADLAILVPVSTEPLSVGGQMPTVNSEIIPPQGVLSQSKSRDSARVSLRLEQVRITVAQ